MKEAIEKCAIWQDLDEETFLRFCQFAYTGSYDGAEPHHAPIPEIAEQPNDGITYQTKGKPKKYPFPPSPYMPTKKDSVWDKFSNLHPGPQDKAATRDNLPNHDYTEVFLSHARIYVFADCYGIVALQNLALCKLRQGLMRYTLHEEGPLVIARLVEYCFGNTADKGGQRDPLRTLVCTYVACKVEDLWKNDYFQELMDTVSEFPRRLVAELLCRLD